MALSDNKTLSWNFNLKQILALVAVFALTVAFIATESIVLGYVAMTLALCGFFLAVAFDVGIAHRASKDAHLEPAAADAGARRGVARSSREV
jgi:hypothetical protein